MATALGNVLNAGVNSDPALFKALQFAIPVIRLVNVGTLAEVATITTAEQTVSVPGLEVGDFVSVNKPTHQAGLGIAGARVSAKDTLAIRFVNPTAAGITPTASEIYKVLHVSMLAV